MKKLLLWGVTFFSISVQTYGLEPISDEFDKKTIVLTCIYIHNDYVYDIKRYFNRLDCPLKTDRQPVAHDNQDHVACDFDIQDIITEEEE